MYVGSIRWVGNGELVLELALVVVEGCYLFNPGNGEMEWTMTRTF